MKNAHRTPFRVAKSGSCPSPASSRWIPRYIAFDEPTAYLDPAGKQRVLDIIRRLHGEGMAIIHIAHDMRDVADADRIVVMEAGRILCEGTPVEVFFQAGRLRAIGLDVAGKGWGPND